MPPHVSPRNLSSQTISPAEFLSVLVASTPLLPALRANEAHPRDVCYRHRQTHARSMHASKQTDGRESPVQSCRRRPWLYVLCVREMVHVRLRRGGSGQQQLRLPDALRGHMRGVASRCDGGGRGKCHRPLRLHTNKCVPSVRSCEASAAELDEVAPMPWARPGARPGQGQGKMCPRRPVLSGVILLMELNRRSLPAVTSRS